VESAELEAWITQELGPEIPQLGLERISDFLSKEREALRDLNTQVVIVAGTNGKGQTIHSLASLLRLHKKSFCLWTSPHLSHLSERYQSDQGSISHQRLDEMVQLTMTDMQQAQVQLSYYEFLFAVFVRWCLKQRPEYVLLEVGLGGRLDAVNIFDAQLVLVPSISRDHMEYLGARYDLILAEKMGVIRPQTTLITSFQLQYLNELLAKHYAPKLKQWINLRSQLEDKYESDFVSRNKYLAYIGLKSLLPDSPLTWPSAQSDLAQEEIDGRGNKLLAMSAQWEFWGAHNTDGLRKCVQFWQANSYNNKELPAQTCLFALTRRDDREVMAMVSMLKKAQQNGQIQKLIFCQFDHGRALDWKQYAGLTPVVHWKDFLESEDTQANSYLVLGSFYWIAQILAYLKQRTDHSSASTTSTNES
jgi:dihydrofolate synthase/folylpolyglutamate synthase